MRCGFFAALLAAVLVLFTGVPGVVAHSQLVSSSPADGAVVAQMPGAVELTFNEDLAEFPQAVVADAGNVVRKVTPTVSGSMLTVPIPTDQPAGRVEVRYRVVSADGHPIAGSIAFTVKGAASPSATASVGASTPSAPAAVSPTGPAAPPAAAEDPSTGWMYILMGLAAVLVIGVGLAIRFMGRRRPEPPHRS